MGFGINTSTTADTGNCDAVVIIFLIFFNFPSLVQFSMFPLIYLLRLMKKMVWLEFSFPPPSSNTKYMLFKQSSHGYGMQSIWSLTVLEIFGHQAKKKNQIYILVKCRRHHEFIVNGAWHSVSPPQIYKGRYG